MIRIGLVDFDTSHVAVFTQIFNHIGSDPATWVDGAQVVAGCPGDSEMMPERIPGYTDQLRGYGVTLVDQPADLLGQIDAVIIASQQGARHVGRAQPFLEHGLPTFVDKPFAGSVAEADAMIALAARHTAPLMSCSALRYAPEVQEALARQAQWGRILSADVYGPATLHPGNPGLLHYGIHGVEILYTLLGPGCSQVDTVRTPQGEVVTGLWDSGHAGTVRGIREGQAGFGFTAHYESGHLAATIEGSAFYRETARAMLTMFQTRVMPIDPKVMREIIAFIAAADQSAARHGAAAPLAP